MRKPRQQRSADSLERVIQSAERLLREVAPEDLTIAQVVADSGVSVGSIYARFADKNGVFVELVLRFMRTTLGVFAAHDQDRWRQLSLPGALHELVQATAEIYREHRGVLRAMSLRSRLVRSSELQQAVASYNEQVAAQMQALLMMHAGRFSHPQPEQAVQTCIEVCSSLLRDAIVSAPQALNKKQQAALVSRTVDLLHRFLLADVADVPAGVQNAGTGAGANT